MSVERQILLTGCWPEIKHPKFPVWQLASSERASQRTRENVSKIGITDFYNLILKVKSHHFCHILFIRNKSLNLTHTKEKGFILKRV